ncbi:MAG: YgjP-like metallopeptidase domain-containing protein [Halanaerobiales bacterium]
MNLQNRFMQIKKIIRSERRTISLQICDDATLIVKAPLRVKNYVINQVILKHHKWLERKKKEILSRDIKFIKKQFVNGEKYFCELKIKSELFLADLKFKSELPETII